MSKYRPLSERLHGHPADEWRTNFSDIEAMLGFPLPKGARSGKAWWEKAAPSGWQVGEVSHGEGTVTFRRSAVSPATLEAAAGLAPVGDLSGEPGPQVPQVSPPASGQPPVLREAAETASRAMHQTRKIGLAALAASVAVVGVAALVMRGVLRRR